MPQPLTQKQEQVLEFVRSQIKANGCPPSLREIGAALRMAAPSVEDHLDAIERKGHIKRIKGERRNIRLLEALAGPPPGSLPLLGRIAAGAPILSEDHIEEWVSFRSKMFHPQPDFLLRVRGDSMQDLGIRSGDIVGVHEQSTADSGQIVIAMILNEATSQYELTLKRFRDSRGRWLLTSENRTAGYPPIEIKKGADELAQDKLKIVGIYCGHVHTGRGGSI